MDTKIAAIYSAIEFVEEHLRDEVSVGDIAVSAGYSLYHFIRVFNQIVHHSPYDYLMRRRLSEAALELLSSERRIIDISLDYCFHNHETFSRAFKRMFAMQPSQWRLKKDEHGMKLILPCITMAYLRHINKADFLNPNPVVSEDNAQIYFTYRGEASSFDLTLDYIYHTWLPSSGLELAPLHDAEQYIEDAASDEGQEIIIPILKG